MRDIAWKLIEAIALQLTPQEREIVLGDLIETRQTAWRGMREVSGLVARRQLQLWNDWRAWLAAPGLALPCSFLLMGFSFAISSDLRNRLVHGWQPGFFSTEPGEFISLLCKVLVLLICAWAAGFIVESVSRRTFLVSAICCFLPCLFCLLRFRQESLPRFCLLLFLFPAVAGVCFSRRGRTINRRRAFALAPGATICMAVLGVRGHLSVLNWELIVPAWYLERQTTPRHFTSPAKNATPNPEMTTSGPGTSQAAWADSCRPTGARKKSRFRSKTRQSADAQPVQLCGGYKPCSDRPHAYLLRKLRSDQQFV
jgi:hypothetical protein